MKIFCMKCGKPHEYFGSNNKPKTCPSCQSNYDDIASLAKGGFSPTQPSPNNSNSFVVGGIDFDVKKMLKDVKVEWVEGYTTPTES